MLFRSYLFSRNLKLPKSVQQIKCFHYSANLNLKNPQRKTEFRNYSVTEINVPVPGGIIAGKLWEPNPSVEKIDLEVPPILCLHGWLDNCGTFDTLIPLLMGNSTRFFAFDLPGHGLTTYAPQWYYDGHIDGIISIQRILRHFGWEKISLLGHSMGGIISFLFNGLYPETVHKYIALENVRPIPRDCLATMRASINLVFEVEARNSTPRKSYKYEDLLQRFYEGRQETIGMEGCKILLKRGALPNADNLYSHSYSFRTLIPGQEGRFSKEHSAELANNIENPVCYIKGDPGNQYESQEELDKFFKIFETNLGTRFESHLLPGTHHFHLDEPEPTAKIIKKFLKEDL